ncbi:hypothetical protein BHM03_00029046 [Ensete ventricosum]|nr:hypothetical protein BHM03_00029046 [Ensete ventricosum]
MSISSNTLFTLLSVTFSPTYSFDVLVEATVDAASPRILLNLQSSALVATRPFGSQLLSAAVVEYYAELLCRISKRTGILDFTHSLSSCEGNVTWLHSLPQVKRIGVLGFAHSPELRRQRLLDFACLLEFVLHALSWLLTFACSLLTLLKHLKCLHSLR